MDDLVLVCAVHPLSHSIVFLLDVSSYGADSCDTRPMAMVPPPERPELAYYSLDWIWSTSRIDLMKQLLLFFDGVTLVLPHHHMGTVVDRDPILAQPLFEQGLLHNFDPQDWMTEPIAREIRAVVASLVSPEELRVAHHRDIRGGLDGLTARHFIAPTEDATEILKWMQSRGLIFDTIREDMVSLPAYTRQAILAALALAVKAAALDTKEGYSLANG
jgi:hypothetical protein